MHKKFLGIALLYLLLLSGSAISAKTLNDPSKTGLSARVIGLGRAFAGISDDLGAMLFNPAGLYRLNNWQMTSMYASLLGDVNYLVLAGAVPAESGTWGLGYISSSLGNIPVTTISGGQIIATGDSINYNNSVWLLSYGRLLRKSTPYAFLDNVAAGATLKIFNQSLTGGGTDATASGFDLDLGLHYLPNKWLTIGLVQQNLLPASLGGKVTWSKTNSVENIPSLTKLGLGIEAAGKYGLISADKFGSLKLGLDSEFSLIDKSRLGIYHFGAEWSPTRALIFRLGFDQEIAARVGGGNEAVTNPALGVGLISGGIAFDYTYRIYNNITNNTTHFFSISYLGAPAERKEVVILKITPPEEFLEGEYEIQKYIKFVELPKKKITYSGFVSIGGEIVAPAVSRIDINGLEGRITNQRFSLKIPLLYGKNPLDISAVDTSGKVLATFQTYVVRLRKFKDVAENYFARMPIEYLAGLGLIGGYKDGTFRPNPPITRAELCGILVKAAGIRESAAKNSFKDVKKDHWAAKVINIAVENKWVAGYPDKTFRPSRPLTRTEAVAIIARFANLKTPQLIYEKPFPDVEVEHWAAKTISAAKNAGLLKFLEDKLFRPKDYKLRRGEAADILSRTEFIAKLIKNLLD